MGEVDTFGLREAWLRSRKLAQTAAKEASDRCIEYAVAEAAYYATKAERVMKMKADGMQVGIIEMTVKGEPDVNPKLMEKIAAEGRYRAAMKAIEVYKDDARMVYDEYRRSMMGDPDGY